MFRTYYEFASTAEAELVGKTAQQWLHPTCEYEAHPSVKVVVVEVVSPAKVIRFLAGR